MRSTVTLRRPHSSDPIRCDDVGQGVGTLEGIMILRYLPGGKLSFGQSREDLLHQLFWSPGSVLIASRDGRQTHLTSDEAFWVRRATSYEVLAYGRSAVYRVCLRQEPAGLQHLRHGAIALPQPVAEALESAFTPDDAGLARELIFTSLTAYDAAVPEGDGYANIVARQLSYDPGDESSLEQWAGRLHISAKTLQRDFQATYGVPFSQWRASARLTLARGLVEHEPVTAVAARVGYQSTSAFIAAYRRKFGVSPGEDAKRRPSA